MKTAGTDQAGGIPRFQLLGPLEVRDGHDRPIPVSAAKQRGVLAALLVDAGTVVSTDRLADLLWDGSPPPSAKKTLENYLSRLRRLLGPAVGGHLVTRSPGYVIELRDGLEVDLVMLADLAGRAQEAADRADWTRAGRDAREALALWRGDPFCDVPVERLRCEQTPHLAEARLRLRELALTAQVMLGDHHIALPGLRRLVEETRIREHPWELLISALYRCGRKAEAFEAYRRVGRILRDELGVDPGRGLQRLHGLMLADDPHLLPTADVHARLPPPGTPGTPPADTLPPPADTLSPPAGTLPPPAPPGASTRPGPPVLSAVDAPAAEVRQGVAARYGSLPAPRTATDPDPARALRLLSGWDGDDLPLAAAGAMLRRPVEIVRRELGILTDLRLLESPAPGRHRLPPAVRVFGRTVARAQHTDAERQGALARLLGWYLQTAIAAEDVLHPYGRRQVPGTGVAEFPREGFASYGDASAWFSAEHANLVTAVRVAACTAEHTIAWQLAAGLTGYLHLSKRWTDWITTAQIGLVSARHLGERSGEAALLLSAGLAYRDLRLLGRSVDLIEKATAIRQETADPWGEACSLLGLGQVHGPDQMIVHHRRAEKIFTEAGNLWGYALTQIERGRALRRLHHPERAVACHRGSAAILADLGDLWGVGLAHLGLAEDYLAYGSHEDAATSCRRSLAVCCEIGDRHTSARVLALLGQIYLQLSDPAAAHQAWSRALRIFENLADPRATQVRVGMANLDAAVAMAS
ncbi:BTAD domain-containing putative transcriptional regulator [Parafrankia sp. BMG5.11]|uniref:BTAD domain-containing putative transcriptional regulator n=1 Tax=Parafrankia sp. BMG5.11 TaxID=222540 RepID=UPI00103B8E28|nr:BTAD domain-containing putative transcriptional regulator [Parafrankia sp. BMG5.11]TCJ34019.1 SARP family transcriptional regulator [Parafrankia sp. BMG5.11]